MDIKAQMILEEFDAAYESLKIQKDIIDKALNKIVSEHDMFINSVESRIKKRDSLEGKLERKGYKYTSLSDLTDLVGARVVTFYTDEVDKFAGIISDVFEIDWENTVDKRKLHDVDRFGYMSLHYICRIPKSLYYDEKHPLVNELRFELQMRTALQHVWASIYHDTGYKSDVEIPRESLRTLSSLAGLLELADKQFSELRFNLSEYRRVVKSLVESGNLNDVELNADSFREYLGMGHFLILSERIAKINNMEITTVSTTPYLIALKKMNITNLGQLDEIFKSYADDAYTLAVKAFSDTDIDIMSSTTALYYLLITYILKAGGGEVGVGLFLGLIYGERKSNARQAKRICEIARKSGVLKE